MVGFRCGKLTVIKQIESDSKGNAWWLCACDCGEYINKPGYEIRRKSKCMCKSCFSKYAAEKMKKTRQDSFINLCGKQFGYLHVVEYLGKGGSKNESLWRCICRCGKEHVVNTYNLNAGLIKSCGCLVSYGENLVEDILRLNNIRYERQKRFAGCKDKALLPFDFYLLDYNICIEFDGEQHRRPTRRTGGIDKFNVVKKHDKMKTKFCKENGIMLMRIRTYNKKTIEKRILLRIVCARADALEM